MIRGKICSDNDQSTKARIDRTDKEIDRMVYALYGLSEEEVAVVEGREVV